jgi:hypothetical protein
MRKNADEGSITPKASIIFDKKQSPPPAPSEEEEK